MLFRWFLFFQCAGEIECEADVRDTGVAGWRRYCIPYATGWEERQRKMRGDVKKYETARWDVSLRQSTWWETESSNPKNNRNEVKLHIYFFACVIVLYEFKFSKNPQSWPVQNFSFIYDKAGPSSQRINIIKHQPFKSVAPAGGGSEWTLIQS